MNNTVQNCIASSIFLLGMGGYTPVFAHSYYTTRTNCRIGKDKISSITAGRFHETSETGKDLYSDDLVGILSAAGDLEVLQHTHTPFDYKGEGWTGSSLTLEKQSLVKSLVILNGDIRDKHLFYRQWSPGVDIVELSPYEDGLLQINDILSEYQELDGLHIVSHAQDGMIQLGNSFITEQDLKDNPKTLNMLDHALRDGGDVLLYGCDLAKTSKGESLLELISNQAHVDVAASRNKTGSRLKNSDWQLEIVKGEIEIDRPFNKRTLKDFSGILAPSEYTGLALYTSTNPNYYNQASLTTGDGNFIVTEAGGNNLSVMNGGRGIGYVYAGAGAGLYGKTLKISADGTNTDTFELHTLKLSTGQSGCSGGDVIVDVQIEGYYSGGGSAGTQNVTVATERAFCGYADTDTVDVSSTFGTGKDLSHFVIKYNGTAPADKYYLMTSFTVDNLKAPVSINSDGSLGASAAVSEPVALPTTADSTGEAVDILDFTLSDGGGGDGLPLTVSQVVLNTSGTGDFDKVTWRLNGPDATNVTGTYSGGGNTITFSSLSISVADAGSEVYTVNAYYNDNTSLTEDQTFILSVDGDTDLTVGGSGTQMGTTSAVTNSTGSTVDVTTTALNFFTQPSGSVSGSTLTTQPVVRAQDAFGNVDTDFTETVTLTEASAGSLTGGSLAAISGVATFTAVTYTATADQQSFTLTANDQDGVGSDLPTTDANSVTSDVVATGLNFSTQPAGSVSGGALTTQPVVQAVDGDGTTDTGFTETVTLTEASAGSLTGGSVAAISGVATFTAVNYTATADQQSFTLTANDQDGVGSNLPTTDANSVTSDVVATGLNFSTQPAGSVSGVALTTQPVVQAVDGNGLVDTAFTETVTLTEASAGTLSGGSIAAVSGVATFTAVNYTATGDQQSFTLTANDNDGLGSDLPTTDASSVTSDVVATKLIFSTEPSPTSVNSGEATAMTTVPVVSAVDADETVDTGYSTGITLAENGAGTATMTATGDTDGDGSTVSITPSSGVSTYTGLNLTYTSSGSTENFTLRATSGGLTLADSTTMTGVVDSTPPSIGSVSIPNVSMKAGDVVTATITVSSDTDDYTSGSGGISGTIGGFSLGSLSKTNNTTYTASFTVTSGGTDVAAGNSIPVNVTITDSVGNSSTAYTTAISQDADPIDANIPDISSVSIPNRAMKVGDAVAVTITADEEGLSLTSGSINGVAVTGFTENGGGRYSAIYTVAEGHTDRTAGENIPVSFVLTDGVGNDSATFTTAISQGVDPIDANTPTISSVSIPNSRMKVGDAVLVNVHASEAGLYLSSGTINGVGVTGFTDFGGGSYNATYTIAEGNADRAADDTIPVSFVLVDRGGNQSDAFTTAISQNGDVIDANTPVVSDVAIIGSPDKNAETVTFQATFSEAVNNIDVADFALTTTGSVSCNIVSVSTSTGSSVDIVVDTIDGSGSLRLDIVSGHNLSDIAGNTINGEYTSGAVHYVGSGFPWQILLPAISHSTKQLQN